VFIGFVRNKSKKAAVPNMAAFLFKIEITGKKLFFNIVFVFSVLLPKFPSTPEHLT